RIVASLAAGAALLTGFVAWELRARAPMVPMRFFGRRDFAVANAASLLANFGMFGSIFLLSQFFQTAQGLSPLDAGLRVLPWTLMPMIVAPVAGALSDRIGGRQLMAAGLALQAAGLAWSAAVTAPHAAYATLIVPFAVTGIGMGMFFAPLASTVLGSVRPADEGKASGVNNAVREVGGLLGVAVLASIFAGAGGYATPEAFGDGLVPATWAGAAVVGAGAVVTLVLPRRRTALTAPGPLPSADARARPRAASAS
ncbi:MAG TPA: MFS transporter, partial [Solirubrobacteraceae bacterium]|nr:MFS transporter [Solirubrobacteraceae bacterium]